jgi:hypothetical protein
VVEDVEELAPQIEVHAFVQGNGARDVHVPLLEAGTDRAVASYFLESLGSDRRYSPVNGGCIGKGRRYWRPFRGWMLVVV